MSLTGLAVTRPVASTVLSLLIVVVGTAALLNLPVREYPDIDDPTVTATIVYPGASAEVVERDVVEPIEEAVSGIDGVRQVRSQAQDGRARIEVEFLLGQDLDLAAADVRARISRVRNELPDQAEDPEIAQQSLRGQVVMWILLTSETQNRLELSDLADRVLVNPLSTVPGVAQVLFGGERRYAMRIHLDLDQLAARELTVLDVEQALRTRNLELPAGRLIGDTRELTLRTLTELKDPEEYRDLIVADRDGVEVRLSDVAEIEYGPESYRTAVRLDGEDAVGLGIVRQPGSNLVAISAAVRAKLEALDPRIPEGLHVTIPYDAATFVEASIRQIVLTLLVTIALVIAVVFLSLGSWRATLVPAATIPASVIGAFILLYALGFSVNVLTLLALILAIGMLVDDAIVVGENVFRYSEQGKPRLLAADLGAGEVAFAVVATTTVLLAVIAPLGFLTGDAGRLLGELAAGLGGALAEGAPGGGAVWVSSRPSIGRAAERRRVDRLPAVTIKASPTPGYALGDVLETLETTARPLLPADMQIRWLAESQDFQRSGQAFLLAFGLALVIVFLVLAAQFESFVQPLVLLAGVPLALLGALVSLWLGGGSINIYSQIGFILTVGIMAKNAILLVEFINQLRDRGKDLRNAVEEAARVRFRPILMTSIATLFGALPLAFSFGPGAETRRIIGLAILGGVFAATLLTLLLVPVFYLLLAGRSRPRAALVRALAEQRSESER